MSIRAIIFDIDGVLVSTKELHEISIISALNKYGYSITHEYHKKELDGLPTKIKLQKLNIPMELHTSISNLKQELTFSQAENYIKFRQDLFEMFNILSEKYYIGICSNAIRQFCELVVKIMKLKAHFIISNEDALPKPNPDMYLKTMNHFNISDKETLICEDSFFGLESAFKSGANVLYVPNPSYLNLNYIERYLKIL